MSMTRKTLALATTALLVIAPIVPGQIPAQNDDIGPGEVREALAKAHELRARISNLEDRSARDAAEQEFKKLVSKYRDAYPKVPAEVGDKARYSKLTMNPRGSGFGAFRFRVPSAGRTYQLFWSFIVPGESRRGSTDQSTRYRWSQRRGADVYLPRRQEEHHAPRPEPSAAESMDALSPLWSEAPGRERICRMA